MANWGKYGIASAFVVYMAYGFWKYRSVLQIVASVVIKFVE
jgi:hypothetical protein